MLECKNYGKVLKKENLRNTSHRNSVLEIIESSEEPVSAENLYLTLKGKDVSISLSTVYRILDILVEKEIVIKTDLTDSHKSLYEMNHKDHRHHLICIKCKKTIPVEDCPLQGYSKTLEERFDFDVTGHRLEMFGYCSQCKSEKPGK